MTEHHINLAFANMVRSGALRHKSMYTAWSGADKGCFRDECITDSCTVDSYKLLWKYMSYMDYENAKYDDDGRLITDGDSIIRVRFMIDGANHV